MATTCSLPTPITGEEVAQADEALGMVYAALVRLFPFFATILLHLKTKQDDTCDTMWTDGEWLGYNPRYVNFLVAEGQRDGKRYLRSGICHEVGHIVLGHHLRILWRELKQWNVAGDHAVNAMLEEAKLELHPTWLHAIHDKCAEEIYAALPPQAPGNPQPGAPKPGQGNGPPGPGEVRAPTKPDGRPLSAAEHTARVADHRSLVQAATRAQTRRGTMPAGMTQMLGEATEVKVPWRDYISRYHAENTFQDYSYNSPNKRYIQFGLYMPRPWSPGFAAIAFASDTSGSVVAADRTQGAAEMLSCMSVYAANGQTVELLCLWCDTEVHPQIIEDESDILVPKGGGGTSFSPVFRYLEKEDIIPAALVYLTDGECSDFGPPPPYPVLWLLTRQHRKNFKPPFGEVAYMAND